MSIQVYPVILDISSINSIQGVNEKSQQHYLALAQLHLYNFPAYYLRITSPPQHSEDHLTFNYTSALSWAYNWVKPILLGKGLSKGKMSSLMATFIEKGTYVDRNKKQSTSFMQI